MALYLSLWFALLASLGVQGALVLIAWLIGLNRSRRTLLGCERRLRQPYPSRFLTSASTPGSRRASVPPRSSARCTTSWTPLDKTQQLVTAALGKRKSMCWRSMKWEQPKNRGFHLACSGCRSLLELRTGRGRQGGADVFERLPRGIRPGPALYRLRALHKTRAPIGGTSTGGAERDR